MLKFRTSFQGPHGLISSIFFFIFLAKSSAVFLFAEDVSDGQKLLPHAGAAARVAGGGDGGSLQLLPGASSAGLLQLRRR